MSKASRHVITILQTDKSVELDLQIQDTNI